MISISLIIDSRDKGLIDKCMEIFNSDFHIEVIEILMKNIDAEPSTIIGNIQNEGLSSMMSDLIFTQFEIPNDSELRYKLIQDCIKKIELGRIKDLKRVINLKLSKNIDLPEDDEKALLEELKILIEREKSLI